MATAADSPRIRIAERIAPFHVRGFALVPGIELFFSVGQKGINVPLIESPELTSNLTPDSPDEMSVLEELSSPVIEDVPNSVGFIVAVELVEAFEPLKAPRLAGKSYARAVSGDRVLIRPSSRSAITTGQCVHGLDRSVCAICRGDGDSARARNTGQAEVDLFDLLLPLLQPPLGERFDNVLAFGPDQKLYEFQVFGVSWLATNDRALLADEMGLGKSIQAIIAMRVMFRTGKIVNALILCPKSIVTDWQYKLHNWAPELRLQVVRDSRPMREVQWDSRAHVHLATYDALRIDLDLVKTKFDLVITDEIQLIRNPGSGRSQAVRSLRPSLAWGLSGTPLENRPDDIVAIFGFLVPGLLNQWDARDANALRRKIAPYVLRRRKSEALTDLPEKIASEAWVELTQHQRNSYVEMERRGVLELKDKGEKVTATHVFGLINQLKQICNVDPVTGESSKLEYLRQRLEEVSDQGDKALVFSQFPGKTLPKVKEDLGNFGAEIFDGSLSEREREKVLGEFRQQPNRKVLLLSTQAGGLGLTLTEANYVFHMDLWWNPSTASQAEDRVHRIGQTKTVFVQYLYAADTIEERIRRLIEQKREIFRKVVDELSDVTLSKALTEEELFGLFGLKSPRATPPEAPPGPHPTTVQSPDPRLVLVDLERTLRGFIKSRLSAIDSNWWQGRVPPDVRAKAEDRQRRSESSWPWLAPDSADASDFVDFSDYKKIIGYEDNWQLAFAEQLLHLEIVRAKLMELEPIRNGLAHSRNLSQEEDAVLRMNAQHLRVLMSSSPSEVDRPDSHKSVDST